MWISTTLPSLSLLLSACTPLLPGRRITARGMGLPPSEMRALNILAVYSAPMRLTELFDRAGLDSNLGLRSISTLRKKGARYLRPKPNRPSSDGGCPLPHRPQSHREGCRWVR